MYSICGSYGLQGVIQRNIRVCHVRQIIERDRTIIYSFDPPRIVAGLKVPVAIYFGLAPFESRPSSSSLLEVAGTS